MKKIRVLQVTGSLRMGGLENVAMNFFRYSDHNLFDFDYVVYGNNEEHFENEVLALGGRIFRTVYPHKNLFRYFTSFRRIIRENGPYDVIHSHSLFNSGLVMLIAYLEKIPVRITHAHSDRKSFSVSLFRRFYNFFMRHLINKYCTKKFACSKGAAKYLYGNCENVYFVNNGIMVDDFLFNEQNRKCAREELGVSKNKVVGHIGRLSPVKNQKKILNCFSVAHKHDPSLKLVIVGEGELLEELKKQAYDLDVANAVIFTGVRKDVSRLLSAFDVFIMPSFYEGVSVSLIEAQASGVNCIISSNAASDEIKITECINILNLDDSDELWAQKINSLANSERISGTKDEIIRKGFNISDIIDKATKYYIAG